MQINAINAINNLENINPVQSKAATTNTEFSDIFKDALNQTEQTEAASNNSMVGLLTGESDDLHSVMIQAEKADLALKLTIQIRNKILDSYSEIMRMQVWEGSGNATC